jgi:hypothetical protein
MKNRLQYFLLYKRQLLWLLSILISAITFLECLYGSVWYFSDMLSSFNVKSIVLIKEFETSVLAAAIRSGLILAVSLFYALNLPWDSKVAKIVVKLLCIGVASVGFWYLNHSSLEAISETADGDWTVGYFVVITQISVTRRVVGTILAGIGLLRFFMPFRFDDKQLS